MRYEWKDTIRATGLGAMSVDVTYDNPFEIDEFRIHVNTAPTTAEDLTITLDANAGAAYDAVIDTIAMAGKTDIAQQATRPTRFDAGDTVTFAWTNTDARTWGIEINTRVFS